MASIIIKEKKEIPEAPFYVFYNDEVMNGWGECETKDCILIFPCETNGEAEAVSRAVWKHSGLEGMCCETVEEHADEIRKTHQFYWDGLPNLDFDSNLYTLMGKELTPHWYEGSDVNEVKYARNLSEADRVLTI